MPSDSHAAGPLPTGLPPVTPPSGKFIVQLFLVPGLIVGLIVCMLLLFNWLFSGPRSPEAFLSRLDDNNHEIRWRAAADLAQVLKRDEHLAGNAAFAFELAERAERARETSAPAEKEFANRVPLLKPEEAKAEAAKLEPDRNYLQYLCACLGNFRVPAGLSVLRHLAVQEGDMEPKALTERRRQAVWSLADLGQNLHSFDEAKQPDQELILSGVDQLARGSSHAREAREMAKHLRDRLAGRPSALGVDETLARCAEADDPFLRELTALALNFWNGSPAENERMEATLLKLAHDSGRGEDQTEASQTEQPDEESHSVVKSPGLRVRLNAAVALARRGSPKTRLDQLDEMLDANRLHELCVIRRPDGTEYPDEAFAVQTQLAGLQAIAELHRKLPTLDFTKLKPKIDKLTNDANPAIRAEARTTQKAIDTKSQASP